MVFIFRVLEVKPAQDTVHFPYKPYGLELELQHIHVPKEIQFLIFSYNGHILHVEDILYNPGIRSNCSEWIIL